MQSLDSRWRSSARLMITSCVLLGIWQAIVVLLDMPPFILPAPNLVFEKLIASYDLLWEHRDRKSTRLNSSH